MCKIVLQVFSAQWTWRHSDIGFAHAVCRPSCICVERMLLCAEFRCGCHAVIDRLLIHISTIDSDTCCLQLTWLNDEGARRGWYLRFDLVHRTSGLSYRYIYFMLTISCFLLTIVCTSKTDVFSWLWATVLWYAAVVRMDSEPTTWEFWAFMPFPLSSKRILGMRVIFIERCRCHFSKTELEIFLLNTRKNLGSHNFIWCIDSKSKTCTSKIDVESCREFSHLLANRT